MISTFTASSYVNRVQESWQPGYGVTQLSQTASPTLYFDFLTGTLNPSITFTRASTASYFDSSGVLQSAAINDPRFDYNPSTLAAQGLLIEEARTNSIRNNTMVGAVAGTPGTLPTNWAVVGLGLGTLVQTVVGTGTINGISYIDIKVTGTISTAGFNYAFEPSTGGPAASLGQTWTGSTYVAIVGGNTTNITSIRCVSSIERNSVGGVVGSGFNSGDNKATLTSTLQRFSASGTLTGATTVSVQPTVALSLGTGVIGDPVDGITLRIGLPQLELGAFATSVIPTTTAALTRSADQASVNTLAPWFNSAAGTLFAEFSIPASTASRSQATFGDGTANERMIISNNTSLTGTGWRIVDGGVDQADINNAGSFANNATVKVAGAYAVNDFATSQNGGAVGTDTSGALPTVTALYLGSNGAAQYASAYLRRITYYPRRLSNAELQAITT
tara:strand:- start:964 stop:2301 length:1338 start_codon:yes stop_codon:yes gene_type:complete